MDPTELGQPNTEVPGNQGRCPLGPREWDAHQVLDAPTLFPILHGAQGAPWSSAFVERQGLMEAQSWMCQWSNLDVKAVPWLFWVAFSPCGNQSCWWYDSHT